MSKDNSIKLVTDFDPRSCEGVCLLRSKGKNDHSENMHVLGNESNYVCKGDVCTRRYSRPTLGHLNNNNISRTLFLSNPLDIGEEQELLIADLVLGEDLLMS